MEKRAEILYVDDEDYMLDCMEATFEVVEIPIKTASSAREALSILSTDSNIKVVISDYRMPEMSGIDFFQLVRENYPSTTRILCSAYVDDHDITPHFQSKTIHHFVHKPWDINALIELVTSSLEQ